MRAFISKTLVCTAAMAATLLALPQSAEACGCLSPPVPDPVNDDSFAVNQQAEQIIFEVEPGFVTAHVLIRYAGEADKFAWIVPVPAAPDLELSESIAFGLIDDATAPAVFVGRESLCPSPEYRCEVHPPPSNCQFPGAGGVGGSGGGGGDGLGSGGGSGEPPPNGIDIINREQIGSYDTVTFGAGDAGAAVAWLNSEGFIVNDTMTPYMQTYIDGGMLFVASKLIPGAGVDQIRPLKMKYASTNPMIPLQLTAVAAEPHLTVTTYILSDSAFTPKDHPLLGLDETWISVSPDGRSNYPMVVARAADDAGGDGFVLEYQGAVPVPQIGDPFCCGDEFDNCFIAGDGQCQCPEAQFDAQDCAEEEDLVNGIALTKELAAKHQTLTRLTTRISAEEMTFDPEFQPGNSTMNGRLELTGTRKQLLGCEGDVIDRSLYDSIERVQECAAVYCGRGECTVTDQGAGCRCNAGFVARTFTDLDGEPSVTCVPDRHTVDYAAAGITLPNACAELSCGANGACVDVGGFPTCQCDDGYAAVTFEDAPLPTCRKVERVSGSSGARDFSDALEDVRVCAPIPPSCGKWGWLVPNESKVRQGVVCPSSVPNSSVAFDPPAKPTCEEYYGAGSGTGGTGAGGQAGSGFGGTLGAQSPSSSDASPEGGGGCACNLRDRGTSSGALSLLALAGLALTRRRRWS